MQDSSSAMPSARLSACAAFHSRLVDSLSAALIDEFDTGVLVCAADGGLQMVNIAGQQELAQGRWLHMVQGRVCLCLGERAATQAEAFAAAARGCRQLLTLHSGDERLFVSISPLELGDGETHVLVRLGRNAPCSKSAQALLGKAYGLTDSERRVLAGRIDGLSPKEMTLKFGVELSTVRTQIGTLHDKLGVNNDGKLIALLGGLPGLALRAVTGSAQSMFDADDLRSDKPFVAEAGLLREVNPQHARHLNDPRRGVALENERDLNKSAFPGGGL